MEEYISLRNVYLDFVSGPGLLEVLRDFSVEIKFNEVVCVVGPSGCGKTTLLKMIGGLYADRKAKVRLTGSISIGGKSPTEARLAGEFGFAFQNPVMLPWRRVRGNLELPREIGAGTKNRTPHDARELLELVGLLRYSRMYPHELSGGMKQRVSLARALYLKPSVLLMDEPFGSLDEVTRERLNLELLKIWDNTDATIIFVTHSISEAVFLGDRVVVMTERPSTVHKIVEIPVPRPRPISLKESLEFAAIAREIRQSLSEGGGSDE